MNQGTKSIAVTGAAGFIGSCLVSALNQNGYDNLILVDDFHRPDKEANLIDKKFIKKIDRDRFEDWLINHPGSLSHVIHLGARTDTTEFNKTIFDKLNLGYSKMIWEYCVRYHIPLIYASSAATYGLGDLGYDDTHDHLWQLQPLNPYGQSKQDFDLWALGQALSPPYWAGLKFFNVYGPNEYHKGRMASVIFHAFHQIQETSKVALFRSHIPEYRDGMQLRDFIYVKDVVDVCIFILEGGIRSGIYNLGTGKARTFLDLALATFSASGREASIAFIDIPPDIRDRYQYFTEAKMEKLRGEGYSKAFTSLEEGVMDYVGRYLSKGNYF